MNEKKPSIKYCLGNLNGSLIDDRTELTEGEYNRLLEMFLSLEALQEDEKLFKVVELNYRELLAKVDYYAKNNEIINRSRDFNLPDLMTIDLNRVVLNFLSAFRTFLDHKETMLKRKFGDSSNEVEILKLELKLAFDNSFEYKFLYKLRNYTQHCGLPIQSPEVTSAFVNNEEIVDSFEIYFDRDRLLNNFDWGKIVGAELKLMPEKFPMLPIIEVVYILLQTIDRKVSALASNKYKIDAETLLALLLTSVSRQGIPCLMVMKGSDLVTITCNYFPTGIIGKLTRVKINFE